MSRITQMTEPYIKKVGIGACLAGAAVIQLRSYVFDGDCAVFGLMALHISQLNEFPLYLWGAHYAGTLSSYIAAGLFVLFGVTKLSVALAGILISWVWIFSQYALARRVLKPVGAFAALLICLFPPIHVLNLSTWSGGVYTETFAFSSVLLLLAAVRLTRVPKRLCLFYFMSGATAGFGQWLSPGMLPAAGTALVIFALVEERAFWTKCLPFFIAGFAVGYTPAIVYNLEYPNASLYRMGGRLLDLDRSFLNEPHKISVIAGRLASKISAGPWNLFKLAGHYAEAAGTYNLILILTAGVFAVRKSVGRLKEKLLPAPSDIVLVYSVLFVIFYSFVVSAPPAFRYALPLYIGAPLLIGNVYESVYNRWRGFATFLLAAVICANLYPTLKVGERRFFPDSEALTAYLGKAGVKYAFSDYNTSYLITFLTKEKILVSPTLLHKDFSDRYPEYTRKVRNSPGSAFIVDTVTSPGRAKMTADRLNKLGIIFREDDVAGYTIFSGLSRRVYPEELGLQVEGRKLPR